MSKCVQGQVVVSHGLPPECTGAISHLLSPTISFMSTRGRIPIPAFTGMVVTLLGFVVLPWSPIMNTQGQKFVVTGPSMDAMQLGLCSLLCPCLPS